MSLTFVGDVFLNQSVDIQIKFDNLILNLEYPLDIDGEPAKNKTILGADKSFFDQTFKDNKPLVVNLANNHIMDYGEKGFSKTIEYLDKRKIKYFGAGNLENNYNNPTLIDLNGKRIALIGYSCSSTHPIYGGENSNGSAILDEGIILKDISICKQLADIVILNLHWGDEYVNYPKPIDVQKARKFIDAGVELIIGHHAHVIQSHEIYKGKYIFYGLGNFLFSDRHGVANYDGEKFQKHFYREQYKENKQALIVELTNKFKISYKTATFNKQTIKSKKVNIPKWIPDNEKQYNMYLKLWKKQRMLKMYFRNPRIPNIQQIKLFLGIR